MNLSIYVLKRKIKKYAKMTKSNEVKMYRATTSIDKLKRYMKKRNKIMIKYISPI